MMPTGQRRGIRASWAALLARPPSPAVAPEVSGCSPASRSEPHFCRARSPEDWHKQLNFCLLYDPTCKCCDPCWGHGPWFGNRRARTSHLDQTGWVINRRNQPQSKRWALHLLMPSN